MVRAVAILLCFAGVANAQSDTERPLWTAYYDCVGQHVADVALHVESLEEGALLIFENLCQEAATDLMNTVAARPVFEGTEWNARFSSARYVIQRETKLEIYRARLRLR